jgi:hypothetical protein
LYHTDEADEKKHNPWHNNAEDPMLLACVSCARQVHQSNAYIEVYGLLASISAPFHELFGTFLDAIENLILHDTCVGICSRDVTLQQVMLVQFVRIVRILTGLTGTYPSPVER